MLSKVKFLFQEVEVEVDIEAEDEVEAMVVTEMAKKSMSIKVEEVVAEAFTTIQGFTNQR